MLALGTGTGYQHQALGLDTGTGHQYWTLGLGTGTGCWGWALNQEQDKPLCPFSFVPLSPPLPTQSLAAPDPGRIWHLWGMFPRG